MKQQIVKVIVFTMAYNAQETIGRTIESILNQTFGNFEYYILDNASTDATEDIISDYGRKDNRIIPLHINKNDPLNGSTIFNTLVWSTDADYIVWCDADDSYTQDFLKNMIDFSKDNNLDIAACGYDKIDGATGEVIKHRALKENLVIYDYLFADAFIQYRGFISYLWGKLYSISFLKAKSTTYTPKKERICNDSIGVLELFRKADRVGIYGKAMYQYYQYPRSLSHTNIETSLSSYRELWSATKEYLEYYGPVSRLNEDFLYAIHLSLMDEMVGNVFCAELDADKKLDLLIEIFSDPVWADTWKRNADPMFRNLAARKEFASDIKKKVLSMPEIGQYSEKRKQLFTYFGSSKET